jgi:hypothetical protein
LLYQHRFTGGVTPSRKCERSLERRQAPSLVLSGGVPNEVLQSGGQAAGCRRRLASHPPLTPGEREPFSDGNGQE